MPPLWVPTGENQDIACCVRKTIIRRKGGLLMDSRERLNLIARVTYYLGWLLLIIGGLVHAGLGKAFFQSIGLPQRNLFEAGMALFLICAASSLRALNQAK
jgi:hypothetical protein